jgi:hypothetical protein
VVKSEFDPSRPWAVSVADSLSRRGEPDDEEPDDEEPNDEEPDDEEPDEEEPDDEPDEPDDELAGDPDDDLIEGRSESELVCRASRSIRSISAPDWAA